MDRIQHTDPDGAPSGIPEIDRSRPWRASVDVTWGTLQPIEVAESVRTVGELEVISHLESGGLVVDSRAPDQHAAVTLPVVRNIPHSQMSERRDEVDRDGPTVFFCNGPQCGQSPMAIRALLEAGHRTDLIWYYRGGLHDWVTLGLPTVTGEDATA